MADNSDSTSIITAIYAEQTEKERQEALCAQEEARVLSVIRPKIQQLVAVALLFPELSFTTSVYKNAWYQTWQAPPRVTSSGFASLHLKGVKSWAQLIPMFETLAIYGYPVDMWENQDNAESYTRIYIHKLDEDISIRIHAELPGDTDDCRRVIKGYRNEREFYQDSRPQPIYAFECGSDSASPETAAETATFKDDIPF